MRERRAYKRKQMLVRVRFIRDLAHLLCERGGYFLEPFFYDRRDVDVDCFAAELVRDFRRECVEVVSRTRLCDNPLTYKRREKRDYTSPAERPAYGEYVRFDYVLNFVHDVLLYSLFDDRRVIVAFERGNAFGKIVDNFDCLVVFCRNILVYRFRVCKCRRQRT